MATLTATGINTSNGTLDGFYTGSTANNTSYPIGSYLQCLGTGNPNYSIVALNGTAVPRVFFNGGQYGGFTANYASGGGSVVSGTWRGRGGVNANCCTGYLPTICMIQRTA